MLRPVRLQCPARKAARALQPDRTNMMCIKIQGTILRVLSLSVALHGTACRKISVQVARATYRSVQAHAASSD